MNIRCPNCQTVFRVDPARVPATGIRARCSRCAETFFVQRDHAAGTAGRAATSPAAAAPRKADAEPAVAARAAPASPPAARAAEVPATAAEPTAAQAAPSATERFTP